MQVFITATDDNRVLSIHLTVEEAKDYAPKLNAAKIFEGDSETCVRVRSEKVKLSKVEQVA